MNFFFGKSSRKIESDGDIMENMINLIDNNKDNFNNKKFKKKLEKMYNSLSKEIKNMEHREHKTFFKGQIDEFVSTKPTISTIKDSYKQTLRIPITYDNHLDVISHSNRYTYLKNTILKIINLK